MKSKVYFTDLRAKYKESFIDKLEKLVKRAGMGRTVKKRDLVAVKLHFGELGNTAFIRPVYIRRLVNAIKKNGGTPFLTDANTLYAGTRGDSVHHLKTAIENGFAYPVVGAPLIIADGLRGKSETAVTINRSRFKDVYIGSEIVHADALVSVAHFKCHELSGFGGTIKNLGMGCASRKGKMEQHADVSPKVKNKSCVGCGMCAAHCAHKAIALIDINGKKKAKIDSKKCVGCGECILICPTESVQVQWKQDVPAFMEKMVEYTLGVLRAKKANLFSSTLSPMSLPHVTACPTTTRPLYETSGWLLPKTPWPSTRLRWTSSTPRPPCPVVV